MEEKGKVSLKSLEKVPWFAILGVLVIINLLIVQQAPNFMSVVVPAYLTQAFLYISLGYAFMRVPYGGRLAARQRVGLEQR